MWIGFVMVINRCKMIYLKAEWLKQPLYFAYEFEGQKYGESLARGLLVSYPGSFIWVWGEGWWSPTSIWPPQWGEGLVFRKASYPLVSVCVAWASPSVVVSGKRQFLHSDWLSRIKKWKLRGQLTPLFRTGTTCTIFSHSEQLQSLPRFKGEEKEIPLFFSWLTRHCVIQFSIYTSI